MDYGLLVKAVVIILTLFWLQIPQTMFSISHEDVKNFYVINGYTSSMQPCFKPVFGDIKHTEAEDEACRKRHTAFMAEMYKLTDAAEKVKATYTKVEYFRDLNKILDIEDTFKMSLDGFDGLRIVNQLLGNSYANAGNEHPTPNQEAAITIVQKRYESRHLDSNPKPVDWSKIINYLFLAYFKLMFMWLLIYLIRFTERRAGIAETIVATPWRFITRLLIWPKWCLTYPNHKDTAEYLRYLRLRAEFLRHKPMAYQISNKEDWELREKAKQSTRDFREILEELNDKYHILPRRSLGWAFLSLALGILLQPAFTFAANHSFKPMASDQGICQLELTQVQSVEVHKFHDPPPQSQHWLAILNELDWLIPANIARLLPIPTPRIPDNPVFEVSHIPLFGRQRCKVFTKR